jgi:hypothetical protein
LNLENSSSFHHPTYLAWAMPSFGAGANQAVGQSPHAPRFRQAMTAIQKENLFRRLWSSAPWVWGAASIPYLIAVGACIKKLTERTRTLGNLHTFRDAAIALSKGQNIYRSGIHEYVYPPLIAFLYQPLGWMSLHWAGAVTLVINAALAIFTLKIFSEELLARLTGQATTLMVAQVALVAAWLSTDHIHTEFGQWETNILVLLMFALALRWADCLPTWAGIALGFAFNIKYLSIMLIPYLIFRRRWRICLAFLISAGFFAILPAISMGWAKDLAAAKESYAGIARLMGYHVARTDSALVHPFTYIKSISLTSAIGRMTGWTELRAMVIAAILGAALIVLWIELCRRQRIGGSFALEWIGIILLTLIFSPYTNSGHLYLLVAVNAAVAVLLLYGRSGVSRWPLFVGAAVMFFGMILPPGGDYFRPAELLWDHLGVPAWCMYVLCITLIWTGAKQRPEG